ncbi:IS30 family transposase [Antrihabitans cavernicola]|uniref:IS30 family transposase n=1 Tax=Antrihabitans cavernicola TaxID=2495913 RepID=A0A5A7SBG3_9NOCA|nr:IS30 family transposase [Spelaeibacter cavernicola]KAA0023478.1 IS30 family transposase [Spelaeibacter cavernicola]
MPLPPVRAAVREFWDHIRGGRTTADAADRVGVSEATGERWIRDVKPHFTDPETDGPRPRLNLADRVEIEVGVRIGESLHSIGDRLGRPASTIKREIDANGVIRCFEQHGIKSGYRRKKMFGARQSGNTARVDYRALVAQQRSDQRARRPKQGKLAAIDELREAVQDRLSEQHSPEQITATLRLDYPDRPEMQVSHETIYKAIYLQGRGGLRRELATCLRTGRALRKPRRGERRGKRHDMILISERPPEIEDRAIPGHWEGDLIIGKNQGSAIGTIVERTSGMVLLLHLPDNHTAEAVAAQTILKMGELPAILRQTLTWDQGSEMANHAQITTATGLDIYFCDPHSPWQRGTNENTNGLLRQYFPKGTDLSVFPADYLDHVALKLNTRPRKRHGFKTPVAILNELLSNPPTVASTA